MSIVNKLFIACLVLSFSASLKAIELADLKKMAGSQQWAEVIENIDTVSIENRNDDWRELLTSSAIALISDPVETNILQQLRMINRLYSYDDLKKNTEFNKVSGEALVKLFPLCLYSREDKYTECLFVTEKIVSKGMLREKDAFALGNIVRREALFERVALPYFSHAVRQMEEGSKICLTPEIRLAVMSGLGQSPDKKEAAFAREIIFGKCWSDLKATLIDNLYSKTNYMLNACETLLTRDVLTRLKAKKCRKALAKAGL